MQKMATYLLIVTPAFPGGKRTEERGEDFFLHTLKATILVKQLQVYS